MSGSSLILEMEGQIQHNALRKHSIECIKLFFLLHIWTELHILALYPYWKLAYNESCDDSMLSCGWKLCHFQGFSHIVNGRSSVEGQVWDIVLHALRQILTKLTWHLHTENLITMHSTVCLLNTVEVVLA